MLNRKQRLIIGNVINQFYTVFATLSLISACSKKCFWLTISLFYNFFVAQLWSRKVFLAHNLFCKIKKRKNSNKTCLRSFYPRGIGPTYELYSSSRRTAVVPLLKNYMQFFLVIFLGWVMLPHPQATITDHGGPRTSDLSIERRRRNHFTTAPLNE